VAVSFIGEGNWRKAENIAVTVVLLISVVINFH